MHVTGNITDAYVHNYINLAMVSIKSISNIICE
jgi:hypothetical protein